MINWVRRASNRLFSFPEPCNSNQNLRCTTHQHYQTAVCLRAEGFPNYDFSSQKCSPSHLNIAAWSSSKKNTTPRAHGHVQKAQQGMDSHVWYNSRLYAAQWNSLQNHLNQNKLTICWSFRTTAHFTWTCFSHSLTKSRRRGLNLPPHPTPHTPLVCTRPAMRSIKSGEKYVKIIEFGHCFYCLLNRDIDI